MELINMTFLLVIPIKILNQTYIIYLIVYINFKWYKYLKNFYILVYLNIIEPKIILKTSSS